MDKSDLESYMESFHLDEGVAFFYIQENSHWPPLMKLLNSLMTLLLVWKGVHPWDAWDHHARHCRVY
jgi:hypothetical protein